ncbi:MAG: 16S rRNA (cytidine(1402)-2'-O)-methyltransferase [Dehalococcoidia bacterium]
MTADFSAGLYVVATPIGNRRDLSDRARDLLAGAAIIACEDTRMARRLFTPGPGQRLVSLTEHNVRERTPGLLEAARAAPVALLSDAGTPVVADPGARFVAAAHDAGIPVFALPGPSALTAALSVAGFEASDIHFLGFLPRSSGDRRSRLATAGRTASVLVFFESPRRIAAALSDVAAVFGDPLVAVCRELTKVHEETVRGRAAGLADRFREARGEFTVVVQVPESFATAGGREEARNWLTAMRRAGARRSAAAAEVARRLGISRSEAYALWDEADDDASA